MFDILSVLLVRVLCELVLVVLNCIVLEFGDIVYVELLVLVRFVGFVMVVMVSWLSGWVSLFENVLVMMLLLLIVKFCSVLVVELLVDCIVSVLRFEYFVSCDRLIVMLLKVMDVGVGVEFELLNMSELVVVVVLLDREMF